MSSKKNLLSFHHDDDNENYETFSEYLQEETNRKKEKTLTEIEQMGESFLREIENKKKQKDREKVKLISYIIKKSGDIYDIQELYTYSFEDVQQVYDETKKKNKPFLKKFFEFLFNL